MRTLLFLPALALVACGTDSSSSGDAPPRVDQTVEADVEPCEALTTRMVADAFGVPEASVTVPELDPMVIRMVERGGAMADRITNTCTYEIAGEGNYDGASVFISGYESADGAEGMFTSTYRTQTAEDLDRIEGAGDQAMDQMEAEGRDVSALEGEDVGGMLAGLASKTTYDDVPGIGDQATLETNRITDPPQLAAIHIRDGAVVYSVSVSPAYLFSQQEGSFDDIRDKTMELGRLVAAR